MATIFPNWPKLPSLAVGVSWRPPVCVRPQCGTLPVVVGDTAGMGGVRKDRTNPRGNMLTHAFGELGLATYLVLEERREVYLLPIEWP